MIHINLIVETNMLFARLYNEKKLTNKAFNLMQKCKKARLEYVDAKTSHNQAKRLKYTPAGWYEEHVTKLRLNHCKMRMDNLYLQLNRELKNSHLI